MKKLVLVIMLLALWAAPGARADDDYVIGDGDTLQLSVWGVTDLSVAAVGRPDGKITIPGVGDITAAGYTPEELSKKITEKLTAVVKKPIGRVKATGINKTK